MTLTTPLTWRIYPDGRPSPRCIEVSVATVEDDHAEITITAGLDHHQVATLDQRHLTDAYRWVAATAARVTIGHGFDIRLEAHRHGCTGERYGLPTGCGLGGTELSLTNPAADLADPPAVWLIVPASRAATWLATVRRSLEQAIAAEVGA